MAALSLTEEMFAAIQGLSYSESIKYITPGSGLQEGMFSSLEHAKYYELDTRLTYKDYQREKRCQKENHRKSHHDVHNVQCFCGIFSPTSTEKHGTMD